MAAGFSSEKQLSQSRLQFQSGPSYSRGVLLGNWQEERLGRYKKSRYQHSSTYRTSFTPKYATGKAIQKSNLEDMVWSSAHTQGPNYQNNFTSTYDLAYEYFPKWFSGEFSFDTTTLRRQMKGLAMEGLEYGREEDIKRCNLDYTFHPQYHGKSANVSFIDEKRTYYSNKVLVGNWADERIGNYKKNRFCHRSVYHQDYTPKVPDSKREFIRNEGTKIWSPREDQRKYCDNFTTTYDLSFQYFPKWAKIRRKEYLDVYGSLSSRNGLTFEKQEQWACDVLEPRRTEISGSKTDYVKYRPESYSFTRYPRLGPKTVQCGRVKDSIYFPLPPQHPRSLDTRKNPILWEGEDNVEIKP